MFWEALVQSQVRFNRVVEAGERLGGFGAEPGQVKLDRALEMVPEKIPGGFGAEPHQVQPGFGEGSRKGSRKGRGGFGAEPGQVQQGSGEGSGEGFGRLWC